MISTLFAAINGDALIQLFIWIVVVGLIYGLLVWLLGQIGLPDPFNKVARILLAVVAVLLLINAILTLVGHPVLRW